MNSDELHEELHLLKQTCEEVLQAIDYATTLKKPRWVREWLLGGDERHPEHAAIAKLRAHIRAARRAEPILVQRCENCRGELDNLQGIYLLGHEYGQRVLACHRCHEELRRAGYTEIARAK